MSKADRWNERYAGKELIWSAGPNALFAEAVAQLENGTALDIACGEGRNALWLAKQGWQVSAMDFSSVAIDKAKKIARHRELQVNWQVDDITTCALPAAGFDLVAVIYLHTDPAARQIWLPKALEGVKPGGTFIYIGHDPKNIEHGVGGPQNPKFLASANNISALMAGFNIINAEIRQRTIASDPGHGGQGKGCAFDTYVRGIRIATET